MVSALYYLSPHDFRDEFYETDKKLIIPLITKLFELIKKGRHILTLKSSMIFLLFCMGHGGFFSYSPGIFFPSHKTIFIMYM